MCGIFGMIRSTTAEHPSRATAVFAALGHLAVERGRDAAGFAISSAQPGAKTVRPAKVDLDRRYAALGQVTIVKDVCSFEDLWDDDKHTAMVTGARVAIGHTRWATQGDKKALVNASPLAVGSLVGTHNGDVETRSVPGWYGLPRQFGSTDTEWLYQALHRDRYDRRKITKVLKAVEGRAALAWLDQDRPDRVYLARAALSPMSIAFDAEGNLYWASNPDWFRKVEAQMGGAVGFHSITMVREGTLLTVDIAGEQPVLDNLREFTPQCRPSDKRLAGFAVWRGFHTDDEAADRAQENRTVAPARYKAPKKAAATVSTGAAAASAAVFSDLPTVTDAPSRWATTPEVWDGSDDEFGYGYDADHDFEVENEADEAIIMWAEEGHDPTVVQRLREAHTPAELEELADEFGLSSMEVFDVFRRGLLEWAEELEDEGMLEVTDADLLVEEVEAASGRPVSRDPQPLSQILADYVPEGARALAESV